MQRRESYLKSFKLELESKFEQEKQNILKEAQKTKKKLYKLEQQILKMRQNEQNGKVEMENLQDKLHRHQNMIKKIEKDLKQKETDLHKDLKQTKLLLQARETEIECTKMKLSQLEQEKETLQQQIRILQREKLHTERGLQITHAKLLNHWIVDKREVDITGEVLGKGGWGEVRVAKFRGTTVAAKFLHESVISDYNLELFIREMTIAAILRHPNLLLFIGAIKEGTPTILTEIMPTSLFAELQKGKFSRNNILAISKDVASALTYLHQWKPDPIIHRDISSPNVLLQLTATAWTAKLSDLGSANFKKLINRTKFPGNALYAAPEAEFPYQHSPKMDVFSFGILLIEVNVRQQPQTNQVSREGQIEMICAQFPAMVDLIRKCIHNLPNNRPSTTEILKDLHALYEVLHAEYNH